MRHKQISCHIYYSVLYTNQGNECLKKELYFLNIIQITKDSFWIRPDDAYT